jgi:hypothetical protein
MSKSNSLQLTATAFRVTQKAAEHFYYLCTMADWLDLLDDTLNHFAEGARSVKAYAHNEKTYIITQVPNASDFWVTLEEPGFPKTRTASLETYFKDVFGIEAHY